MQLHHAMSEAIGREGSPVIGPSLDEFGRSSDISMSRRVDRVLTPLELDSRSPQFISAASLARVDSLVPMSVALTLPQSVLAEAETAFSSASEAPAHVYVTGCAEPATKKYPDAVRALQVVPAQKGSVDSDGRGAVETNSRTETDDSHACVLSLSLFAVSPPRTSLPACPAAFA